MIDSILFSMVGATDCALAKERHLLPHGGRVKIQAQGFLDLFFDAAYMLNIFPISKLCQSPDHLQGPQAQIHQNCCGDCQGNSGCRGECWGNCCGDCRGDCPCSEEQRNGISPEVSAAIPPAIPPAPRVKAAILEKCGSEKIFRFSLLKLS